MRLAEKLDWKGLRPDNGLKMSGKLLPNELLL
jgi:hypothetical protein